MSIANNALQRCLVIGTAASLTSLVTANPAQAQGSGGPATPEVSVGHYTDPSPVRFPQAPEPPSVRFGLAGVAEAIIFELAPIDELALLAEDMARSEPMRIGVSRSLGLKLAEHPEAWFDVPGGRLWAATVTLDGAQAVRLELSGLDLPAGAELWAYDTGAHPQVQGPFEGRGPFQTGQLWTTDFISNRAYIEYFVPTSAERTGNFEVPSVQHIYRSIEELGRGGMQAQGAGPCHLDVLCYPAWHPLHNATAWITFIDGGSFLCSATLLNTTAVDQTPYLLTANHCVSTQAVANTVTSRYFYQTASCNGANASFAQVSACDMLVTNATVDISILMQNGALPSGLTWAGWTNAASTNGTQVTGISHPAGARKKISFGSLITHPFGDATHFYGISWSGGTIEGGSSGSALYRNDNQLVIGVCSHSATPIDCSNPDGPSGYGKFPWFYNNVGTVATLMAAGSDDAQEPNDSCASSWPLPDGTYTNRIVKRSDEDWFTFSLPNCQRIQSTVTHTNSWGDIDVELYNGCGGPLLASDVTAAGTKLIDYVNSSGSTQQVKLRVYMGNGDADTRNSYTLFVARTVDPLCGCPLPVSFCAGAPNSVSTLGAYMGYSGTTFVSSNNLVLEAHDLPPNKTCRFFYGQDTSINVPFGNGVRCINGPFFRLPATTSDGLGNVAYNLDLTTPPSGGQISAGQSWGFQNWYRDPAGGGAFFNSSDGLKFTFCP